MANGLVVHLSSVHYPFDTRIFHKECKSLLSNGYEVHLIAQYHEETEVDGVLLRGIHIPKGKLDRFIRTIPSLILKLRGYKKGTIFHFHDPELIPVGIFLKLIGRKVIYDVHEDVPKAILSKKWIPTGIKKPLSLLTKLIERTGASLFDGIITVVPTITDRFKNITDNVIEVRNYPIFRDNESMETQANSSKKYVTYVGSLTAVRGIPQIVEAMEFLDNSEIELWLGGSFGDRNLKNMLEETPGWGKTRFLDWLSRGEVDEVLSNAIAGLVVLNDTPSYREALPVKMFEYMRAGLPVIATNIPLWEKLVKEEYCGLVVPYDSPEKIAGAIKWIYDHPNEAKKMGENGKKAIMEKFNWKIEEQKLLSFYEEI